MRALLALVTLCAQLARAQPTATTPAAEAHASTLLQVRSCTPARTCSALDERLTAELASLHVLVRVSEAPAAPYTLAELARAAHAVAAVRVTPDALALELWLEKTAGPTPTPESLERIPIDPESGWSVSAVSALEALRARLLARPSPARAGAEQPGSPPTLPTRQPSVDTRGLWLRAASGVSYSPGNLGMLPALLLSLRVQPSARFSASVFSALSLSSAKLTAPEGTASVRHTILGVAADVAGPDSAPVSGSVGAGLALALLRVEGQTNEPAYRAQVDHISGLGPLLRTSVAAQPSPTICLRLELLVGVNAPHAVVRFAGREVASWGRPYGLLTLGLELNTLRR